MLGVCDESFYDNLNKELLRNLMKLLCNRSIPFQDAQIKRFHDDIQYNLYQNHHIYF